MAKKLSIEESFEQLDTLIGELQEGDLTLEESFKKYEEGMKLIKHCSESIDKVEKKLEIIEAQEDTDARGDNS
ncbi:MAG: exodeoxyribonuclease VII small subunit [Lachnospiraceae bacterium]|nr:exodeoxyribonuclease VII small subunit [Lachnospiraceae bacterium]